MFEVNEEFEIDSDFLDKVFASEKEALKNRIITQSTENKQYSSNVFKKPVSDSICGTNRSDKFNSSSFLLNEGRNPSSSSSTNNGTPKRNTCTKISLSSKIKRPRKFPGPAGLLPERNHNTSLNISSDELDSDDFADSSSKDGLCSQGTLSGSLLEEEPWQSFLSDLGAQQEVLKVLNVASVKKKAAARLLSKKKVPFLAAVLHYIDASAPDPCVILRDTTGEIHGTLHRNVWDEFGAELKPGCVIVLRNVGVLTTGYFSRRHYLNITGNNLVTLYAPSQGKLQGCNRDSVATLNFLKFIEDWRSLVNPGRSPLNVQSPSNALSLFNTSLTQTSNSPQVRCIAPRIRSGAASLQNNPILKYPSQSVSQLSSAGGKFVPSTKRPQQRSTTPDAAGSHIRNDSSNLSSNMSVFGRGRLYSPVHQPCQNTSYSPGTVKDSSSFNNCNQPFTNRSSIMDSPNTFGATVPMETIKNNNNATVNQMIFSQSDFISKSSQDLFSSSSLNSDSNQRLSNSTVQKENENCDGNIVHSYIQTKKPKIVTNKGLIQNNISSVQNNKTSSFKELNNHENLFSFNSRNQQTAQNEILKSNSFSGTSQCSLMFSRALKDEEKSAVESVLDGFDSDAFFDDF